MRIYYHPGHASHAPEGFVNRGQIKPCPEMPRRAEILHGAVVEAGHELIEPAPADVGAIRRVHDSGYLDFLEQAWAHWSALEDFSAEIIPNVHPGRNMSARPDAIVGLAGYYQADCACPVGPGTWQGALASAAAALATTEAVMGADPVDHAYALCRPPGHHAYADMAGGFCYVNNTAAAAQRCLDLGAARVAVLDVDVHHGNGTQGIFYRREEVLTVSLHGDPSQFYPFFAGYGDETGEGPGRGANLNLPLARGTGDDEYLARLDAALERILAGQPDILVVALGLDASQEDPLAFLALTTEGFAAIGRRLGGLALPTVLIQEGGYVSPVLGHNLAATLGGFEQARAPRAR